MKSTMRLVLVLAAVMCIVCITQAFAADEAVAPTKVPAAPTKATPPDAPHVRAPGMGAARVAIGAGIWQFLPQLELTPEQQTKAGELRKVSQEKLQVANKSLMTANGKLNDLINAGASEADIRAVATEIGKATGDQAVAKAESVKAVKEILTDAQKTKLAELMAPRQNTTMVPGQPGAAPEGQRTPRQPRPVPTEK